MMPDGKDFFVSYTGADKKWAEWIAWVLEEADYETMIQAWDFNAASNFVLKMQSGATDTARTVAVLTPDYFKSAFTQPEWSAAFADDPKSEHGKLIAIRIADFEPPGLFKAIVYIDLVGLDEIAAKEKLIKSVGSIVTGQRLKPDSKPAFPGIKSSTAHPSFPGTPVASKLFLHNLPFASNPFFTGRDKMLNDLYVALQKKTAAAITQPQAVHGLGGVGKTQLAIEYAWKYQADYDVALWAGVPSSSELHARIAALAAILILPEAEAKEQEIKVQAVLCWLRSHQRWLLILDNADTKEAQIAILQLLPPGLHGHIIATSRRVDWPVNFADLEVPVLPEPAATEFLLHRPRKANFNPGNEADALAVAKELGCLPLALEQAGAYIARHHVSFLEYLKLLRESRAQLMKFPSQGGTGYQHTVATTWLVSEQQLSLTARVILQISAFFAPDDIPRAMFSEGTDMLSDVVNAFSERFKSETKKSLTKLDISDALAELADLSLIELGLESFSCHRLLQAVLIDRLPPEGKIKWVQLALRVIRGFAPVESWDIRTWPVWDKLRVHATVIVQFGESVGIPEPTGWLMNNLALLMKEKALFQDAEAMSRRALSICEKIRGSNHPNVATCLINLAMILQETNQPSEAEPLLRRALAVMEKTFGPDSTDVGLCLNSLAIILLYTNRLSEAEPLMRRALAIAETDTDPNHKAVATALNNLASLFLKTNRLSEAEPLLRRALVIEETNFGLEHPNVAMILSNLATLLGDTNRLNEAEPLIRRALAIHEKSFGQDHPSVAACLSNLAVLFKETNRTDEAEKLLRRAIKIDEKSFGPDHPTVAIRLINLASLLQTTDRLPEAEQLTRRALAIDEKSLGLEHPEVAIILNNLALILRDTNRLSQVEPLLRRALAITEKSLDPDHPEMAIRLGNLAQFLRGTNRLAEAEPLMRQHLIIFNKFNIETGYEHPHWEIAIYNYRELLTAMGMNNKQIEAKLREVLDTN
jgi:tetratricopeptide (TPR) repeat protein